MEQIFKKSSGLPVFQWPQTRSVFLAGIGNHRLQLSSQPQHSSDRWTGKSISQTQNWTRWSSGSFWMCSLWTCKFKGLQIPSPHISKCSIRESWTNQCFNNKNKRFNYACLVPALFEGYWHFCFHWLRTCCEYHLDQEDWWHFERIHHSPDKLFMRQGIFFYPFIYKDKHLKALKLKNMFKKNPVFLGSFTMKYIYARVCQFIRFVSQHAAPLNSSVASLSPFSVVWMKP